MVVADPDDPSVATTAPAPRRRLAVVAATASVVLLLDQLSKWWIVAHLSDGHTVDLVGGLKLLLAHNAGAAFSIGSNSNVGPLITILAAGVVVVLVMAGSTTRSRAGAIGAGLVAGGAIGNLADRAFRHGSGFMGGRVVDFIYLSWWPTFNVADSGVCVGAAVLVVFTFRDPPTRPARRRHPAPADSAAADPTPTDPS